MQRRRRRGDPVKHQSGHEHRRARTTVPTTAAIVPTTTVAPSTVPVDCGLGAMLAIDPYEPCPSG